MTWADLYDWQYLSMMIVVVWAALIITIERVLPYDAGEKFLRRGFWLDFLGYALLQSYVLGLLINAGLHQLDAAIGYAGHGVVSGWPVWLQLGVFVLLHDLYIYWFHRWQHKSKYLWRIHEAHHSARHIDWIAGSRSHSLEILINQSIEVGAMILLGVHPDVVLMKMTISVCWGVWIHCNVDVRTGWLQKVINGPQMHRWHHALNYQDRGHGGVNFGTKFAFWDWIHGTAYLPADKPGEYGIDNEFPEGYIAQHLAAFRPFDDERPQRDETSEVSARNRVASGAR